MELSLEEQRQWSKSPVRASWILMQPEYKHVSLTLKNSLNCHQGHCGFTGHPVSGLHLPIVTDKKMPMEIHIQWTPGLPNSYIVQIQPQLFNSTTHLILKTRHGLPGLQTSVCKYFPASNIALSPQRLQPLECWHCILFILISVSPIQRHDT